MATPNIQHSTFNPIYMGSDVDYKGDKLEITTGDNGQIINKAMADHQTLFEKKVYKLADNVYVSVGNGLSNCVMVEGDDGIIIIDTDSNIEAGQLHLNEFRKITDKPVKGIIYTHYHYVSGTCAFINPADMNSIPIWAHEKHFVNLMEALGDIAAGFYRRLHIFHGSFLPVDGPDAMAGEGLGPVYQNKDLPSETAGYLPPNHFAPDGVVTKTTICGVDFEFHPATSETDDSMIVWMPKEKISFDNHAWPTFANLYSLRGTAYRDPLGWMRGIDIIRGLEPEYSVCMHGVPLLGKENIYNILTQYRDSIQFLYDSTVIGFNNGKSAEEIIAEINIPKHLSSGYLNNERYGEIDYYIRGIYNGIIGWFGNDTSECHRLTPKYEAARIIESFGGIEKTLAIAETALDKKEYIWAAQVAGYAVTDDYSNSRAKGIKAKALRAIAQVTPASGTRAFYMTEALTLEGKADPMSAKSAVAPELILSLPPDTFVRQLRFQLDQEKIVDVDDIVVFNFTDIETKCGLHIRKGVVEYIDNPANWDVEIQMPFELFAGIVAGDSISENVKSGKIKVIGDPQKCVTVMSILD